MSDRRWSSIAVNECILRGVDHFFVAPGSRCTPLTLAVAHHDNAIVTQHFDERGLAFAALGYARATGKPGVFICTSGTAVANAFPAVIEAAQEGVPMLLFTADRPPELRGTGANQTIDQQRIFGNYVRHFFDMPCPYDGSEDDTDLFVRSQIETAIEHSQTGPSHLNWMFREPFTLEDGPVAAVANHGDGATTRAPQLPLEPINISGDTIIALGGCTPAEARIAEQLADRLNSPLVTDITSQLRGISPEVAPNITSSKPTTILHMGGRIVSKAWLRYAADLPIETTRHLHLTSKDIRIDPNNLGVERIVGPLKDLTKRVMATEPSSAEFLKLWQLADQQRRSVIEHVLKAEKKLSEPALAFMLAGSLPDQHGLFLGNSTPIRDFDWYASWPNERDIVVAANRGASGIDGLIATAVGFANGLQRRTTLVLGDLSALHDLNSLALVANSKVPMTVVIINNQAGHIFDLLPVAKSSSHFERYFATPHSLQFEQAAGMFGIEYLTATNLAQLAAGLDAAQHSGRTIVLEARTDRQYNMLVRQQIAEALAKRP